VSTGRDTVKLTQRFEEALVYAFRLHAEQVRKGSQTPYVAHLLGVANIVLNYGGDEDQAIAALLHDAVEDQGGRARLEEIRQNFGEEVAEIVAGCTDAWETPKPPWRKRKEAYLQHLKTAPPGVVLVSCADKIDNARSTLRDYRRVGEPFWSHFRGGKTGTLWYYHNLVQILREVCMLPIALELAQVVSEIEQEVARQSATG
jgi:(p)ppGpp synthase/HD superfamily hydrolase